ncbi:DNA-formamidopyrimidine glycosylase family protein [Nonomuraea rubra]|uniref:DNA-formamidopyrimidine glycosylase family protein n=1 Tax=Nonomuraea rubra TaxID=46180 RepID=UPI0036095E2A
MPEGHLIHRHAREQHAALAGHVVRAAGPQGRFDARPYDGRALAGVEAVGKHLLYHFEDGLPAIHVHLGMRGIFLRYDDPAAEPRRGTRLRLATGRWRTTSSPPPGASPSARPASARCSPRSGPTRCARTRPRPRRCGG